MYYKNFISSIFQTYSASKKDNEISCFVFEMWIYFNKIEWGRETTENLMNRINNFLNKLLFVNKCFIKSSILNAFCL